MLLTADGTLKIADFGLAIDLNQERAVTRAGAQHTMQQKSGTLHAPPLKREPARTNCTACCLPCSTCSSLLQLCCGVTCLLRLSVVCCAGTLDYMAPEVLRCPVKEHPLDYKHCHALQYNTSVDVWAVGVLAYELLVGFPPFASNCPGDAMHKILACDVVFPKRITAAARGFVQDALRNHPGDRPTITQMSANPWINSGQVGWALVLCLKHVLAATCPALYHTACANVVIQRANALPMLCYAPTHFDCRPLPTCVPVCGAGEGC